MLIIKSIIYYKLIPKLTDYFIGNNSDELKKAIIYCF